MSRQTHPSRLIPTAIAAIATLLALAVAPGTAVADASAAGHRASPRGDAAATTVWRSGAIARDAAGNLVFVPGPEKRSRSGSRTAAGKKGGPGAAPAPVPLAEDCAASEARTAGFAVPEPVEAIVRKLAPGLNLDPHLVFAVIKVESNFQAQAVSPKSAQGLMQLIPETQERFGVRDPFDPAQNIRAGMTYLRWLLDNFNGSLDLALAGYNAGEKAVQRHNGIPPYPETQDYVEKVLAHYGCVDGGKDDDKPDEPTFAATVTEAPERGWHALGGQNWEPVRNPYDLWNAARDGVAGADACAAGRRGRGAFAIVDGSRCQ